MKNLFAITVMLGMCYNFASAQSIQCSIAPDTIDFKYNNANNMVVEALLNDADTLALMFHTDVGSVSLTPEMISLLISKEKKQSTSKSWTGSKEVSYTEGNTLRITDRTFENLVVWVDMLSGPGTDGKFGPNMFEGKVIEINNDHQFIALHETDTFRHENEDYKKFDLSTNENNSLFIEGEITVGNQIIKNKFLIHSGYGGTIILDDHFYKSNPILHDLETIEENELKDSHGNIIKTKKVKVDSFQFCDQTLNSLPISYFVSDIEIQKTSLLGCEILRRCNMYIDVVNMKIHLRPSTYFNEAFGS